MRHLLAPRAVLEQRGEHPGPAAREGRAGDDGQVGGQALAPDRRVERYLDATADAEQAR